VAAIALGASPSWADPSPSPVDVARADALFQEGRTMMEHGQLHEACPKFEASFQLAPRLGTMINLGACFEQNGQLARALAIYERAATMAHEAGRADRERAARELAAAVEPRVARLLLVIDDPTPGLSIRVDGEALSTQSGLVPIDPGRRELLAQAPGKKAYRVPLDAHAGETFRIAVPRLEDELQVSPPPSVGFPRTAATEARDRETPHSSPVRTVGIVTGLSLAAVGVGVGTGFGVWAFSLHNQYTTGHCDASGCDAEGLRLISQAKTAGNVSTISFVAAGACLAGAALFFVLVPTSSSAKVGVSLGPAAAGIVGSF
jgi:hypothetical protein